jgi:hypothetical protein
MRAAMAIDWIAREREKPGKDILCNGPDQRYTEITHDPLLFSVAQGLF